MTYFLRLRFKKRPLPTQRFRFENDAVVFTRFKNIALMFSVYALCSKRNIPQRNQIKQTAIQHDVLFKVAVSYYIYPSNFNGMIEKSVKRNLSRDTSSTAENKTKI
jgi:hypothetical protein